MSDPDYSQLFQSGAGTTRDSADLAVKLALGMFTTRRKYDLASLAHQYREYYIEYCKTNKLVASDIDPQTYLLAIADIVNHISKMCINGDSIDSSEYKQMKIRVLEYLVGQTDFKSLYDIRMGLDIDALDKQSSSMLPKVMLNMVADGEVAWRRRSGVMEFVMEPY